MNGLDGEGIAAEVRASGVLRVLPPVPEPFAADLIPLKAALR
ncbi:hypothetical protein AGMMS49579_16440 [Spirochaetia bacterium]|nr:hypothetical protein AGMMS49579_16440 [Spirochaetia bacterium]